MQSAEAGFVSGDEPAEKARGSSLEAMIQTDRLGNARDSDPSIENIAFSVGEAEVCGLLGSVGSGGGALMKILATLVKPSEGRAFIGGLDLVEHPEEVRRMVGYQPNYFGSYENMLAWEYLEFFSLAQGVSPARLAGVADRLLETAGLRNKKAEPIGALNQEERQKLGLVKSLAHDPPVLLLDDPGAGLDGPARRRMRALIGAIRRMGKTILINSNIASDLIGLCDSLALIRRGRLLEAGPAERIVSRLDGARAIEIETHGDAAQALEPVKAHPHVRQARAHGKRLIFYPDGAVREPADLIEEWVHRGIPIAAWREHEIDLDQYESENERKM
jgi:ABC-2 type transport system ATP-binding protein